MNLQACCVCLKDRTLTVSVENSERNNIKWFTKLQSVVPEVEWLKIYVICRSCTKLLEEAWEFKKLVLDLENVRRNRLVDSEISKVEDIEDNCDTKHFSDEDQKIKCELCLEFFLTHTQLRQHKLHHSKNDVFTCYNCNITFRTKSNLINHIKNKHKTNNSLLTIDEGLQNEEPSKECLIKENVENDELNSIYNKPNVTLKEERGRAPVIKKRRGRKPLRKFSCEICNEEFDCIKEVAEHCITLHSMERKLVKPYLCEKCDMRFASSASLDQHRNYHSKNRTYICSLCGKGFITKSDLTVHEYTHYNRRNYKCTICDKAFNTNKNLRTHCLVVHTDHSLWKYGCSVCEKRFPLKTNFNQHLRRHTGEKEFACHICKKPFISKSELQRHLHRHSNIRAFKCSHCDKEYKEQRTYRLHLAKVHGIGDVKVTVREKKFVCHICPSQFYDKQKLMRHIYSHSGIKPFQCYVCDKKFTDKSYLKHHLKTTHSITEQSSGEVIQ